MANYYSHAPETTVPRYVGTVPAASAHVSQQPPLYGSFHGAPGPVKEVRPFVRTTRRRMNIVAVILALLVPVAIFSVVLAVTSFSMHYQQPAIMYAIVGACFVFLLFLGVIALDIFRKQAANEPKREPSWYVFIFATGLLAWTLAVLFGNSNFRSNMQPFYDVLNLNTYPSVDPSRMRGQQLMDAGRIVFIDSAQLDLSKSMGFKNLEMYCVAPVTLQGNGTVTTLPNYDFWAVGLNCCSGGNADFHCGEFNNARAHAGLRLMQDDQRAFFRLAVQQAEAAYSIQASHPIFLHWMQDPMAEVNAYQDTGFKYFLLGICSHFVFQLFLVLSAVFLFAKWGGI